MSTVGAAVSWIALAAGLVGVLLAARWLLHGSPAGGGRKGQLAMMLFGLVVLLNAVPRLADASSGVTLVFGVVGLFPLVGFVVLLARVRRT